jgi:DNA-binding response OmpR family regulator
MAVSARILVVEGHRDIGQILSMVLTDAGFLVSVLAHVTTDAIRTAVNQLEPDCVLLGEESSAGYGQSWDEAAWLGARDRVVPVIMLTVSKAEAVEARAGETPRSKAAKLQAVVDMPFDIDEVVDLVAAAVGHATPFDPSPVAEQQRSARLKAKLEAAGAQEIHLSTRREWANFRTADGTLVQIYWWEREHVYYVIRHAESGGRLDQVGRFYDLDAAISLGMLVRARAD